MPKPRYERTIFSRSFVKLSCQRSRLLGTGSLPAWNRRAGRQSEPCWSPLFICRTSASSENASCCYLSFFYQVFVFSAVCTRLFHHGVSVCLQGNQLLHVAVACCSARQPSTSGHKRPCQLMPKPGSCFCPRHRKQLLHVNFFTAREEIKATTPVQRAWIL